MKIRTPLALVLLSWSLIWAMSPRACQADITFQVTVDTTPLIGHPAAPFAVNFQLIDGNAASNTATISGFAFGGGSPSGVPILTGGASGDLSSVVTLMDSAFLNDFVQDFNPGTVLSFIVHLTTNVAGLIPDSFSFALLDGNGFEIPTTSPIGGFVNVDITGPNSTIQSYGSDPTIPVGTGDPVDIPAPEIAFTSTVVPEPSSALVFLMTLVLLPVVRVFAVRSRAGSCPSGRRRTWTIRRC